MTSLSVGLLAGCGSSDDSSSEPFPSNVALAGIINIEANTRVDLDTGENLAFGQEPLSVPQELPANFVLAGYVSDGEGLYPPIDGLQASSYVTDPIDDFRLPLKAGETLVLQTFATRAADSDPGSPVTFAIFTLEGDLLSEARTDPGAGATEVRVTLPNDRADGDYRVVIEARGEVPVRYVMTSPANIMAVGQSFEWPDHDFMPGEAIVAMAPGKGDVSAALSATGATMSRALGGNVWLAKAPSTVMQQQASRQSTVRWVESLRKSPGVSSAIPNYVMSSQAPTAEPLFPRQWHYSLIDTPTAWQLVADGGEGVTVAVLDTGLFRQSATSWHSDLNANVLTSDLLVGSDFVDGDNVPADPGNSVGNSVYHGTHVAGTVAAVVNSSGGTGLAFGSSLLPVRVLGEGGSGSSADLLDAIRWVGGLDNGGEPKADIANMSLGGLPFIQPMQDAITAASDNGVIFVAAAGNSNTSVPSYPAAFDKVFSVSAVDGAGDRASYSNFGGWIDLAAPGGDATRDANSDGVADLVLSASAAFIDGGLDPVYIGLQGTSMAAPHFSGVLALMKGVKADLNYEVVAPWLATGALTDSTSASRTDDLGFGVLDAGKALFTAISDPALTILSSSPSLVSLNSETQLSETVTLTVLGDQTQLVDITSINSEQVWLSVSSEATVAGDDTFTFEVELIPEELKPGVAQQGMITVTYESDMTRTVDIPVAGQRITDQQARNAGRHFVLLVEPEPNDEGLYEGVAISTVTVEDGQYRFTFLHADGTEPRPVDQVPAGKYLLVAGSDFDNDNLICQAGEACAEYPISGLRQEILITSDETLSGVEITTSYSRPTITSSSPTHLPRPGFEGYRLRLKDQNRTVFDSIQKAR
ncbi:S8 family serine peptidase [Marinobacter changyiensis]|uniref:S8 family serine peptidase n=1 Tax=Marinobacter changyiensis TaxID=2604091 RepID=UPI0015D3F2E1|nr:S8 family serine peptidase [Marinobacter changyiensis]